MSPPPVPAARTPFLSGRAGKTGGVYKRSKAERVGVRLEQRDINIAEALETIGVLTTGQIQLLAFSPENDSAAKRRLTKLRRAAFVDRLPRSSVNDQYVYFLPRRKPKLIQLEHQLGVSELYVRVARACRELGFGLKRWLTPSIL